jgi:hypothetical protein
MTECLVFSAQCKCYVSHKKTMTGMGASQRGEPPRGLPREVMLYLVGNHAQEVILPRESVPHEVTL